MLTGSFANPSMTFGSESNFSRISSIFRKKKLLKSSASNEIESCGGSGVSAF